MRPVSIHVGVTRGTGGHGRGGGCNLTQVAPPLHPLGAAPRPHLYAVRPRSQPPITRKALLSEAGLVVLMNGCGEGQEGMGYISSLRSPAPPHHSLRAGLGGAEWNLLEEGLPRLISTRGATWRHVVKRSHLTTAINIISMYPCAAGGPTRRGRANPRPPGFGDHYSAVRRGWGCVIPAKGWGRGEMSSHEEKRIGLYISITESIYWDVFRAKSTSVSVSGYALGEGEAG